MSTKLNPLRDTEKILGTFCYEYYTRLFTALYVYCIRFCGCKL